MKWTIGVTLREIEKEIIKYAIRFYDGDRSKCASSLGISDFELAAKLKIYEIEGNDRGHGKEHGKETGKEGEIIVPLRESKEVQEAPQKHVAKGKNR